MSRSPGIGAGPSPLVVPQRLYAWRSSGAPTIVGSMSPTPSRASIAARLRPPAGGANAPSLRDGSARSSLPFVLDRHDAPPPCALSVDPGCGTSGQGPGPARTQRRPPSATPVRMRYSTTRQRGGDVHPLEPSHVQQGGHGDGQDAEEEERDGGRRVEVGLDPEVREGLGQHRGEDPHDDGVAGCGAEQGPDRTDDGALGHGHRHDGATAHAEREHGRMLARALVDADGRGVERDQERERQDGELHDTQDARVAGQRIVPRLPGLSDRDGGGCTPGRTNSARCVS